MVLAAGAGLAVLLLLYGLLWAPLQRDLARLRAEVPKEHQQLERMRAQAGRIQQLRAGASAAVPRNGLLSFVEQSAQTYNVRQNIRRVEPDGSNSVRLAIDAVAFNSLLEWLANLQKQGGVRIDSASLEPSATSGTVNARLLLRVPGS
jgi:general secretion pathway protein M